MPECREPHVFGPVPSRRLGRSLGVDLVPFKVCPFDCIYCQLGRTTTKTVERRDFMPANEVLEDLAAALADGPAPDYITLSGSGEPTLHAHLGEITARIKKLSDIPAALLTNGALFDREEVRHDAALADVVLPSLDAPNAELFERINRPHEDVAFDRFIEGLVRFREEYAGRIWLEVFLLKGINDTEAHVAEFNRHIERIRPDRIHLNTAVRPTAESAALALSADEMARLCEMFGPTASVAAGFEGVHHEQDFTATRGSVFAMLQRRPCTLADVADGLGIHRNEAVKHVTELLAEHKITAERRGPDTYYRAGP